MNNRVKTIRTEMKLSQEAFGKLLAISGASVSKIESGENNPSDQTVLLICKEFDVSESWLRTGEGEMFVSSGEDSIAQLVRDKNMTPLEESILRGYVALPPQYRAIIMDVTKKMADAVHDNAQPEPNRPERAAQAIEEAMGKAGKERVKKSN